MVLVDALIPFRVPGVDRGDEARETWRLMHRIPAARRDERANPDALQPLAEVVILSAPAALWTILARLVRKRVALPG